MTGDRTQSTRQPKGIPTGGQFATSARSESGVALDGSAADSDTDQAAEQFQVLFDSLDRLGVDSAAVAHDVSGADGRTLVECWETQVVAPLHEPEQASVDSTLREMLGNPDFGRERSDVSLVWYDPTRSKHDDDEEGQWVPVDSLDEIDGRVLVATISTRNGGGNRECWCDPDPNGEEHPDGPCTAVKTEALQARPDYLHDSDDDGDCTYADFYFTVDPADPRLAVAVQGRDQHRRQERARNTLAAVESGKQPPWVVMPVNEATQARAEALRAEQRALTPPDQYMSPHWGRTAAHLAYWDEVIETVRTGGTPPAPPVDPLRGPLERPDTHASAYRAGHEARVARETRDALVGVLAEHSDGTLSPAAAVFFGGREEITARQAENAKELAAAESRVGRWLTNLDRDRAVIAERAEYAEKQRSLREEQAHLDWALRWPNGWEDCPAKPV